MRPLEREVLWSSVAVLGYQEKYKGSVVPVYRVATDVETSLAFRVNVEKAEPVRRASWHPDFCRHILPLIACRSSRI